MIVFYLVTALAWLTVSTSAKHLSDGFDRYLAKSNVRSNSARMKADPNDCCDGGKCEKYRGTISTTVMGLTCLYWDKQNKSTKYVPTKYPELLEENYCRNPSDWPEGLWCYVEDPNNNKTRYQKCEDPCGSKEKVEGGDKADCCTGQCKDYRGRKRETKNGKPCQRWDSTYPHTPKYTKDNYPEAGLEDNYCRNPNDNKVPWCYTMEEKIEKEDCDVSCGEDTSDENIVDPEMTATSSPDPGIEKVVDPGKPACHADCKDPGSEPECRENQTAYLVIKNETCLCSEWTCIWRSCEEVPFDPNNPIECEDTCTVPKKMDDCGCPVWKCTPLDCDAPINIPKETCDSECDFVNTTARCGCNEYKCDAKKPQKQDNACADNDKCGKCQTCITEPYISEACSAKTGYTRSFCGQKNCELPKTCSACEEEKRSKDDCGCEQVECVPKTIQDNCLSCNECEECVLTEDSECSGTGIRSCQPKACQAEETPTCNECQDLVTERDRCNCGKSTCQWKKESVECDKDNDCGKGCNKYCHKESVCQFGSQKIRKHECRNGNRTDPIIPPPKCTDCEDLKPAGVDSCGRNRYTCVKRECPVPEKEKCEGECEQPMLDGEDSCGCPTYTCGKRENSTKPPSHKASCDEGCSGCDQCGWIHDPQCGDWKPGCTRNCNRIEVPRNPNCFKSIEKDECGCDKAPIPLPCNELPKGPCSEGSKPMALKDTCGCEQKVCMPCKEEFDPSSCNKCQMPVILSEIGFCRKGQCVQRKCDGLKNMTCGECEELRAEEDECGCTTVKCAPKKCTTPSPCKKDETLKGTHHDRCGCVENLCSKECKKTEVCLVETCTTKVCEVCGDARP